MLEESYQAGVDAFAKDPRVPPEAFKDLADQLGALKLIDAAAAQKRRSRLTTTTAKSMSWRKPVSSNGFGNRYPPAAIRRSYIVVYVSVQVPSLATVTALVFPELFSPISTVVSAFRERQKAEE